MLETTLSRKGRGQNHSDRSNAIKGELSDKMDTAQQHDRAVATLTGALNTFFAERQDWTVITGTRWRPLADFPNVCHKIDAMIVSADAKLDWDASQECLGPGTRPLTIFDVVTKHNYDFDEFFDAGQEFALAGVYEYCVWDPTEECLRPSFQVWRQSDSELKPLRTCSQGVFFSRAGFRMDVRRDAVEFTPSGNSCHEEELFTCQERLKKELARPTKNEGAIAAWTAKINRLRERLRRADS